MKRCILKKIMMMTLTIIMVLSNGQNISAIEVNKLDTEVSNQNKIDSFKIDYLTLANSYIDRGETQKIVIGFSDSKIVVTDMSIKVYNSESDNYIESEGVLDGDTVIFEMSNLEIGLYSIYSLSYIMNGVEEEIVLNDIGITAQFGVEKETDNNKPNEILSEEESISESAAYEVTNLDNGETKIENSIANALDTAVASTESLLARSSSNNKLVIVLDPGHGGSDGGATSKFNGRYFHEKELNLKIAQACKKELETYRNVSVYMTRNADAYFGLEQRVGYAKSVGANVFISIHNNSADKGNPHGANVFYPNSSYNAEVGKKGKELAQSILKKLVELGIANDGVHIRNSESGDTYPDGSQCDYYSVIRNSKKAGIPGIIVEHAYISNQSDVMNYLSSDEKLKALGVADARGIAQYYGLQKGDPNGVYSGNYSISDGIYTIETKLKPNMVMDVFAGSKNAGANVQLYKSNGSSAQKFKVHYLGNGLYSIQNLNSNLMLDVQGASLANGANVQQYVNNKSDAQKWIIKSVGNGYYSIYSYLSGKAIDVCNFGTSNGTNIQMYYNNRTNAQKFRVIPENVGQELKDGTYCVSTALNQSKVLDVAAGSMDNGANIQLYQSNGTDAQKFELKYLGNGYYSIICAKSKKSLDVYAAGTSNGTNVQQYTYNGTKAQKWMLKSAGNGYYYIINAICGSCLDVKAAKTQNGTNVQMYEPNGSTAQKFKFTPVKDISEKLDGIYYIQSALDDNMTIDVFAGSRNNGANVQLYRKNGTKAQQFKISSCGNGYYNIINMASGKALDVYANKTSNYANVQQYTYNGSGAQKWLIKDNNDGTYSFVGYSSGKYLDVQFGLMKNGANIQIYSGNGSMAQKFKLVIK